MRKTLRILYKKPEVCRKCGGTRILEAESVTAGVTDIKRKYLYMCCGCGERLGFADHSLSPEDLLRAMARPDLSAKYEVVVNE